MRRKGYKSSTSGLVCDMKLEKKGTAFGILGQ
jgi:hypothetical protein